MSRLQALVVDGPCFGSYDVRRATKRMVFTRALDGRTYALDEPGDTVEDGEQAFVYETDGSIGFICGRGPCTRTVTYAIAATMHATTGEVQPLSPDELAAERRAGRERVLAWATGGPRPKRAAADPARAGGAVLVTPLAASTICEADAPTRPRSRSVLGHGEIREVIGSDEERLRFDRERRREVDAVLAASCEFRHHVLVPATCMSRGEAQHILRALDALKGDGGA